MIALKSEGTLTRTATRLRISQSAVSKRIAALERSIGQKLIEKSGREVVLTQRGLDLILEASPLIGQLRSVLTPKPSSGQVQITIGVSESVFCSWGARLLEQARQSVPNLVLSPHTHRSPAVLDRVRSGEYQIGLCSGLGKLPSGIVSELVVEEPMALVRAPAARIEDSHEKLLSIESKSATWKSINTEAAQRGLSPDHGMETFFGVAQAALSGFGTGLVPIGVARALKIPDAQIQLVSPKLTRPVSLVAQKSNFNAEPISQLISAMKIRAREQRKSSAWSGSKS
ncbi:MAG: LysR family transcriptional regulator [Pseudomonadota bacterium]